MCACSRVEGGYECSTVSFLLCPLLFFHNAVFRCSLAKFLMTIVSVCCTKRGYCSVMHANALTKFFIQFLLNLHINLLVCKKEKFHENEDVSLQLPVFQHQHFLWG